MHFTQQYTYTTCHSSHTHMGHAKHKTHNTQQNNMLIIHNVQNTKKAQLTNSSLMNLSSGME